MALPYLFADNPHPGSPWVLTTLANNMGPIAPGASTFNVADPAPVALHGPGQFVVAIDDEYFLVTAGADGITWTVAGAQGPSSLASHMDGSPVYCVTTADALASLGIVQSVNGRTGGVVLTATDVGADLAGAAAAVLPGMVVSGAAAPGDLLTATSPSAATWVQPSPMYGDFAAMPVAAVAGDRAMYCAVDIGGLYQVQLVGAALAWQVIAAAPVAPVILTQPVISGIRQIGSVLTVSNGTWSGSGISFTYQWRRDTVPIGGATSNTHTLVSGDGSHVLDAVVTATNSAGTASVVSVSASIFVSGTGTAAQAITLPASGISTFTGSFAIPADAAHAQYIQFPAPLPAVTDTPGIRVIVHNLSTYTPIIATLLNADNSVFATLSPVEPGGGPTSYGIVNETAPGVPAGALKLALQNIVVGDVAGFQVYAKAWAV